MLWSDCTGQCTEKTAADLLVDELKKQLGVHIKFKLHAACDACRYSKDVVVISPCLAPLRSRCTVGVALGC